MASTYSNLKIELIGSGEQPNTWGQTTNVNLGVAIEEAIVGQGVVTFASDSDVTLTLTNSNFSQTARSIVLKVVSSVPLTATRNLVVPAIQKPYYIFNDTTGGQKLVVKTTAGTGVTIPSGGKAFVYTDGINVVPAQNSFPISSTLSFKLPTTDGTAGQLLQTDGNGNLLFSNAAVGLPVGVFAYWPKTAATPTNYLTFIGTQVYIAGTYPQLDAVIPSQNIFYQVPQADIPNPFPSSGDKFGQSVAIDGDYLIVGSPYNDDVSADSGGAYIYFRTGTVWALQASLPNPFPAADDYFGWSVDISGDYAVVGAYNDDYGTTNAGAAFIYYRTGTSWDLQAKLTAPSPVTSDNYGYDVAIDGDTAVVGAYNRASGGTNSGVAFVYTRSGTIWSLQATLDNPNPTSGDLFGLSVDIDGDTIAVGAPFDDAGASNSGYVYVFTRSGTTWSLQNSFPNPSPAVDDYYGWSVSVSGDRLAVGVYRDDTFATDASVVYTYKRTGTSWASDTMIPPPAPGSTQYFGYSVSIDGSVLVVGAPVRFTGTVNAGAAYQFQLEDDVWTLKNEFLPPALTTNDFFGWSVSASGNYMAVGANGKDSGAVDAGNAYVYTKQNCLILQPLPSANSPTANFKTLVRYAV